MHWAVTLNTVTIAPPSDAQVDSLVDALRAYKAAISIGEDRVGCTMTVPGANALDAGERATAIWRDHLLNAGILPGVDVELEVITTEEQDLRLAT